MIGCPANLVKSSLISKLGGNSLYENESVFGFRARRLRGEGRQPWREGDRQVNPRISYIKYKAGYKSVFSRLIARFVIGLVFKTVEQTEDSVVAAVERRLDPAGKFLVAHSAERAVEAFDCLLILFSRILVLGGVAPVILIAKQIDGPERDLYGGAFQLAKLLLEQVHILVHKRHPAPHQLDIVAVSLTYEQEHEDTGEDYERDGEYRD